jgi:hypothetical protein
MKCTLEILLADGKKMYLTTKESYPEETVEVGYRKVLENLISKANSYKPNERYVIGNNWTICRWEDIIDIKLSPKQLDDGYNLR